MREALSYDDVLLVPRHGVLEKRADADISGALFSDFRLDVPIISANMPAVTNGRVAVEMSRAGGIGALHRFNTIEENSQEFFSTRIHSDYPHRCIVSLGLKDGLYRAAHLYDVGAEFFCLDVAHGDCDAVFKFVKDFKSVMADETKLIVGNICTRQAAWDLAMLGVDAVKVGIGPGAACRTREVTGFGVPQLSAVMEVSDILNTRFETRVIADGGIKNSGDIVKALAAGADTVMIGGLFAGCPETNSPGEYWGNASVQMNGHRAPEGVHGVVDPSGTVRDVMKELAHGIRSGVSYGGVERADMLRYNVEFIRVGVGAQLESSVRIAS